MTQALSLLGGEGDSELGCAGISAPAKVQAPNLPADGCEGKDFGERSCGCSWLSGQLTVLDSELPDLISAFLY